MSHGGDFSDEQYERSRSEYEATRTLRLRADKAGVAERLHRAMMGVSQKETELRYAQAALTHANERLDAAEIDFRIAFDRTGK